MTEEVAADVLESLAAKLDSLHLSPQERSTLDTILARAESAEAEVEGFGVVFEIETTFKGTDEELQAGFTALRLGQAMGFRLSADPGRFIGETEKN